MKQIAAALLQAQKNIRHAQFDASNPHFKNDYASLESVIKAVKVHANNAGLVIVQSLGRDSFGDYLKTTVLHESGEIIESSLYLTLEKPTMQSLGSAISYARRYSVSAMFSIAQTDDDGNSASNAQPPIKEIKEVHWGKELRSDHAFPQLEKVTILSEIEQYKRAVDSENPAPVITGNGSYVCKVGKKHIGKSLNEIGKLDVAGYAKYLVDSSNRDNKPLTGDWAEFVIQAEIYNAE